MKIFGIDFTSRPTRSKPLTCMECTLTDGVLKADKLHEWSSFEDFQAALQAPGPWLDLVIKMGTDGDVLEFHDAITARAWLL